MVISTLHMRLDLCFYFYICLLCFLHKYFLPNVPYISLYFSFYYMLFVCCLSISYCYLHVYNHYFTIWVICRSPFYFTCLLAFRSLNVNSNVLVWSITTRRSVFPLVLVTNLLMEGKLQGLMLLLLWFQLPRMCLAVTELTADHHNMCCLVQLLPDHSRGK